MFSHVSVCSQGVGVHHWTDIPLGRPPPGQTQPSPWEDTHPLPGQTPLPQWLLQRTIRILLEFILVTYTFKYILYNHFWGAIDALVC